MEHVVEAGEKRQSCHVWANLANVRLWWQLSQSVKLDRDKTLSFKGFMTNQEKELFLAVPSNEFNTYWIPCTWFVYRLQVHITTIKLRQYV